MELNKSQNPMDCVDINECRTNETCIYGSY